MCGPGTVRVPAKYRKRFSGMLQHYAAQAIPHDSRREVRQKIGVGNLAFVPARFAKRRDVREEQNVVARRERLARAYFQIVRRFFSQLVELEQPLLFGAGSQLFDQRVIVQLDIGPS